MTTLLQNLNKRQTMHKVMTYLDRTAHFELFRLKTDAVIFLSK